MCVANKLWMINGKNITNSRVESYNNDHLIDRKIAQKLKWKVNMSRLKVRQSEILFVLNTITSTIITVDTTYRKQSIRQYIRS